MSQTPPPEADRFSSLFGRSRGGAPADSLGAKHASAAAVERAAALTSAVRAGRLDTALDALGGYEPKLLRSRKLLAGLLEVCAEELSRAAAETCLSLLTELAKDTHLCRTTSETLVVVHKRVHLLREPYPNRALASGAMTACSSPAFIRRCQVAPRGSWLAPDTFGLTRCTYCEPHAGPAPECLEGPDFSPLRTAALGALSARAHELTKDALMNAGAKAGLTPQAATQLAHEAYRHALIAVVADELCLAPEPLVRTHLVHGETVASSRARPRELKLRIDRLIDRECWTELCQQYVAGWLACERAQLLDDFVGEGVFRVAIVSAETAERARLRD